MIFVEFRDHSSNPVSVNPVAVDAVFVEPDGGTAILVSSYVINVQEEYVDVVEALSEALERDDTEEEDIF